jgi:hypothetical protein
MTDVEARGPLTSMLLLGAPIATGGCRTYFGRPVLVSVDCLDEAHAASCHRTTVQVVAALRALPPPRVPVRCSSGSDARLYSGAASVAAYKIAACSLPDVGSANGFAGRGRRISCRSAITDHLLGCGRTRTTCILVPCSSE